MEEKLYISDEALEKYGYAYFKGMTADDYKYEADSEFKELEDGLLVSRSDMYDIYLQANEEDEGFNDIDDIKNIKAKTKELKAYKQALEKYQATFTEEGLPRDAEADLSDYADCEELTQDALVVQAQIKESLERGDGMSLEEIDMDELDKLLDD